MVNVKTILFRIFIIIYLQIIFVIIFQFFLVNFGNTRADFYMDMGKNSKAIMHYNRVLRLSPQNLYALIWGGYANEEQNKLDTAMKNYDLAIKYHPDIEDGYFFKATLLMHKQNYDEAKIYFSKTIDCYGIYYSQAQKFLDELNRQKN